VKAYAGRLGLKAADFGAHSLRSGFLTGAARCGASVFKIRDVSRHKSMDVLQAYVRDADVFRDYTGAGLTLERGEGGKSSIGGLRCQSQVHCPSNELMGILFALEPGVALV
jgi:hypothetical protein